LISLEVAPEVSAIDPTASLKLATIEIPGLTTRRAKTTVNLYDGQSFAIAGLIQKEFKDQVRGIPGLSNIPILGALFSSTDFQQDETELVIIVTPHLVRPAAPGQLATPADTSTLPSSSELFLHGQVEGPAPPAPAGGLDGRVGHVMR
jgi:pilus assembly protein CpaC